MQAGAGSARTGCLSPFKWFIIFPPGSNIDEEVIEWHKIAFVFVLISAGGGEMRKVKGLDKRTEMQYVVSVYQM